MYSTLIIFRMRDIILKYICIILKIFYIDIVHFIYSSTKFLLYTRNTKPLKISEGKTIVLKKTLMSERREYYLKLQTYWKYTTVKVATLSGNFICTDNTVNSKIDYTCWLYRKEYHRSFKWLLLITPHNYCYTYNKNIIPSYIFT